jgi:glycosyltransferase involved in cell wall biosynthesis
VQAVTRALLRAGAWVDMFTRRVGGDVPQGLESVTVHRLPGVSSRDRRRIERSELAANDAMARALHEAGPFDLVYERYSLWSHAAMEYARVSGAVGVLEVNAPLIDEQSTHRALIHRSAAEAVARRAFGAAHVLVAVSQEVADYLEGFQEARGKVHVVPNGVDTERFRVPRRRSTPEEGGCFKVGFLGGLKPWHGLPVLVEAFARLHQRDPNVRLVVVGDGPERENLMQQLEERGLDGVVHLTGAVAPDEVPDWLATMDVGCAPYAESEGFYFSPLKVFEYMAAGLPVVASRCGQLNDLLRNEWNGLLCPPGDVAELEAALDRLRCDARLRWQLGRAGRAMVERNHSWDQAVRTILSLAGVSMGAEALQAERA